MAGLTLTPEEFAAAFPFHLAFDRRLSVVQFGPRLQRVCPGVRIGAGVGGIVTLKRPEIPMEWDRIVANSQALFLLRCVGSGIVLRGQMLPLADGETMMYLASPWFTQADAVVNAGLAFDDFAIHDPGMDMLLVMQAQSTALGELKDLAGRLSQQRLQLRATASRLEALLRNLQAGVIVEDADRRIVLANSRFCEMFRIPSHPEALAGTDCRSAAEQSKTQFAEPDRFIDDTRTLLERREAVIGEEWAMVDGRVLERDYVPVFVGGEYGGHLWSYRDVTARRRAEAELTAEKDLLAATLGGIIDGVAVVDVHGRVQLLNPAAATLTGWSPGRAAGRLLAEVLPVRDAKGATIDDLMAELRLHGSQVGDIHAMGRTFSLRSLDGRRSTVVISAIPMHADPNGSGGTLVVFRDVTAELEADRMKQDFVNAVSHELRTPLTSIQGFIETMQAEPDMPWAPRREFLGILRDQAARLRQLVDRILEVSQIESGGLVHEVSEVDLAAVAEKSLLEVRPQAAAKSLRIETAIQPGMPPFSGDAVRLQSAITNLLANAVKFTTGEGWVRLQMGLRGGEVRIAVSDSGLGIPEEHIGRIFEKFYRVPRAGLHIPGTGLGLPIVRSIVEHYGGRIEVESREGLGSCFRIYLPLPAPAG